MAVLAYYAEFSMFSDCENWIAAAIDRSGHYCVRVQRNGERFDRDRVSAVIKNLSVKVLLLTKTPEIGPKDFKYLREMHPELVIAFWTFDWMQEPWNWEWYGKVAPLADICFQTDGWHEADLYKEFGVNRKILRQAADPLLHEIPKNITKEECEEFSSDISFFGSIYTERRQALIRELRRYDFKYYGSSGREVWNRYTALVCQLSKIVIGDNFINHISGYWSDRPYIALGCGAFHLTAYVPGIEDEFQNHKHLVWFESFEEMHELIKYYLPREGLRRAIATAGHDFVHENHTYDNRIAYLVKELKAYALGVNKHPAG